MFSKKWFTIKYNTRVIKQLLRKDTHLITPSFQYNEKLQKSSSQLFLVEKFHQCLIIPLFFNRFSISFCASMPPNVKYFLWYFRHDNTFSKTFLCTSELYEIWLPFVMENWNWIASKQSWLDFKNQIHTLINTND